MKQITVGNERFMIRGNWTSAQLKEQYRAFVSKYRSELTFRQWLIERGKVYVKLQ